MSRKDKSLHRHPLNPGPSAGTAKLFKTCSSCFAVIFIYFRIGPSSIVETVKSVQSKPLKVLNPVSAVLFSAVFKIIHQSAADKIIKWAFPWKSGRKQGQCGINIRDIQLMDLVQSQLVSCQIISPGDQDYVCMIS